MKWLVEDSDLTEEDLEGPAARIDRGPPRRRWPISTTRPMMTWVIDVNSILEGGFTPV